MSFVSRVSWKNCSMCMLLLLENVYVQLIVIFLCIFPESLYETWNSIEQHYFATLPLVYQNLRYERSMRTPMLLEVPNLIDFLKQVFICDEYHVEMLLFRVLKCSSVVIVCLQSKPSWVPTVRCSMFTILISSHISFHCFGTSCTSMLVG